MKRTGLVLALMMCVGGRGLYAQTLPKASACAKSFSLEEFRAVAFEKSPLVAQIDSEYAGQVAKAFDSEVLANPELQAEQVYTRMKLGGADDPQTNASISQPLRLSNFGARGRVAALMRKAGDVQKRAALLELSQKVSLQFHSLQALQVTERIIGEAEQRAARQAASIHEGIKKGLLSEGEHRLFEGEKYRLQSQRRGIQAALLNLQAEVSRSLGIPCIFEAASEMRTVPDVPSEDSLLQSARQSDLTEATRVDLLLALNAEQVRVAELDAFPEFAPRVVYQHTNDGGDFIGAGISIPLPLFNRNQGGLERTRAEAAATQRKREFLAQGGLESQIRVLRRSAQSSVEQARIYESKVVPAFREALRAQERLYSQGKGNVLQIWQALRTYSDAQRESLSLWLQALGSRMQLSVVVGGEV
jgi:cobalt-zinc-cadmium efflux system outer membrane protein